MFSNSHVLQHKALFGHFTSTQADCVFCQLYSEFSSGVVNKMALLLMLLESGGSSIVRRIVSSDARIFSAGIIFYRLYLCMFLCASNMKK